MAVGDFDPNLIVLTLIPSGIGFALFVYGKKQQRIPQMIAGVLFGVYPYFTPTVLSTTLVGVALGAGLWCVIRMGY